MGGAENLWCIYGHRRVRGGWHPLEAVRGVDTPWRVRKSDTPSWSPSILSKKYPKIIKSSIFLLNFHQKSSKFSQNFPTICVFRPNARKLNAWFVNFFEKDAKIIHFSQISNQIFWKFSGVRWALPPDPPWQDLDTGGGGYSPPNPPEYRTCLQNSPSPQTAKREN